jgi:hypothetical protein
MYPFNERNWVPFHELNINLEILQNLIWIRHIDFTNNFIIHRSVTHKVLLHDVTLINKQYENGK